MRPIVSTERVVGLDVARALALLGMMATHILPGIDGGEVSLSHHLAGGRASALFAVLAGVSIALMSGRRAPQHGQSRVATSAGLAVRAGLIATVGLVLGELDSGIAVILTYYGLLFLLAIPFLGLRARSLAALSVVWLVAAPVVSQLLRPHLPPPSYANPTFESLTDPWQLLTELTFTGYYPVVPWLAYLFAGMALGRVDLARWSTTVRVIAIGAAAALTAWFVSGRIVASPEVRSTLTDTFTGVGWQGSLDTTLDHGLYGTTPTGSWWWLAVDTPHTATPFDLAHTIGTSLLAIGVCLAAGKVAPNLLAVVFGAGAMTLTLYSAHVALRTDGWWDGDTLGTYFGQVAAVLLVGAAYRLARRRGPLESAVGEVQAAVTRAAAPTPRR
ncbi:MAG TPA: heparan-alpha-glucosaminide N-acetyltransferase domain-containing protein [Nocardioidaceae bacterium]|nr:heparan-alpha-glucosaminide N-acetyltransferase domain-containing protein [Nocardioidaceae bacterium]